MRIPTSQFSQNLTTLATMRSHSLVQNTTKTHKLRITNCKEYQGYYNRHPTQAHWKNVHMATFLQNYIMLLLATLLKWTVQ